MITYEILRKRSGETAPKKQTLHLPVDEDSLSNNLKKKRAIFDKAFTNFWANVGDTVVFKGDKRSIHWTVAAIETDWQACKWSKGNRFPLFIRLERTLVLRGKRKVESVHTSTHTIEQPKGNGK